jgi:hypothetical protein
MPKRKPLVTQHLENISGDVLTEWSELIAAHTKGRQGIYALYRRRKLYYVGLARNLSTRLKAHLKDRHQGKWDRFSVYLTIDDQHMRELEALLLRIVKPSGNKVKGKFAKSQNLLQVLKKEYMLEAKRKAVRMLGVRPSAKLEKKLKPKVIKRSKATGKKPILARYTDKTFRLIATIKGMKHKAWVRKDGAIRFAGQVYNSPSLAGEAACGHKVNGWHLWKYEMSPGYWVYLEELRKQGPIRGKK